MNSISVDRSPKFGALFVKAEYLLTEYIKQPSVQQRNLIAALLYPYYESVCRWFKYRTSRKAELPFDFADACQECYLAAIRAIELCPGKAYPMAFIVAWIKNTARHLLYQKPKDEHLVEITDALALKFGLYCQGVIQDDRPLAIILAEIAQLSEAQQSYIHLVWIRGYSPTDAGKHLGVVPSAVCGGLKVAKKKLQRQLQKQDFARDFAALPDQRDRAWQLRMQGIEKRIISERLGVGINVLGGWFERDKAIRQERRNFRKTYLCIKPDGTEFTVSNLTQFSILQGLKPNAMHAVANNKQEHCNGWQVKKMAIGSSGGN